MFQTAASAAWFAESDLRKRGLPGCDWRLLISRRRNQHLALVPHEVVLAVDGELVVLAHEDRRHRAGLFAVAAEDAARLVDLVRRRVARAGHHRAVVLRRLEVDRIGRARHRAETAGHALL